MSQTLSKAFTEYRSLEKSEKEFQEELAGTFAVYEQLKGRKAEAKKTLLSEAKSYFEETRSKSFEVLEAGKLEFIEDIDFEVVDTPTLLSALLQHCQSEGDDIGKYIKFQVSNTRDLISTFQNVETSPLSAISMEDGEKRGHGYKFVKVQKISIRSK